MDKEQKYSYWQDVAVYDLNTAEAMLAAGRFVYVAFMCQQALEKLAKGLYCFFIDDDIPRVILKRTQEAFQWLSALKR